jgi:hypothetical protein
VCLSPRGCGRQGIGVRATTAAKRKLADALDNGAGTEQPRASTRGQRMSALAAAAVEIRAYFKAARSS